MTPRRAVLFDFDGTFADTAPDLCAALNHLRAQQALAPLDVEAVRPYASMGARGLLRVGFGLTPDDAQFPGLREAFLARYDAEVCAQSTLFEGIPELLRELGERDMRWGIVTNKATRFATRIVAALGVRPDCFVCGDSTPHLKPHPAPMLLAAQQLRIEPSDCLYLGDDLRDIQAARAAGMRPVAVEWGYTSPDTEGPASWNADFVLARPQDLIARL